jgi:hypothetical protein
MLTRHIDVVIPVIDLKVVRKCKKPVCKTFVSSWHENLCQGNIFWFACYQYTVECNSLQIFNVFMNLNVTRCDRHLYRAKTGK